VVDEVSQEMYTNKPPKAQALKLTTLAQSARWPFIETLFQNGSAARQPDPEKIQAELYEQLGRLQMELAWVGKKSAS
jgi:hypothetical protein